MNVVQDSLRPRKWNPVSGRCTWSMHASNSLPWLDA